MSVEREIHFMFTGGDDRDVPDDATHVSIHESITSIPPQLFQYHQNIIKLICHDGVIEIGDEALGECPCLQEAIIPGVRVVEHAAFCACPKLSYVKCDKLEIVKGDVFTLCKNLKSINMPFAREIEDGAFDSTGLIEAKFGSALERFREEAFADCFDLERLVIPLREGLTTHNSVFQGCFNLKRVDLVEDEELRKFAAALHLQEWGAALNDAVNSINQILCTTSSGNELYDDVYDTGEKAQVIRNWTRGVLRLVSMYKEKHRRLLTEAAVTICFFDILPTDLVLNRIFPYLELPTNMVVEDGLEIGSDEELSDEEEETEDDEDDDENNDKVEILSEDSHVHGRGEEERSNRGEEGGHEGEGRLEGSHCEAERSSQGEERSHDYGLNHASLRVGHAEEDGGERKRRKADGAN